MSSDDYQVHNIYRYARKSYKKNCRREAHENDDISPQDDTNNVESDNSPRSERVSMDLPGCSCDLDHDGDVASILHKKCPVITLARQQLKRLLEDTDKMLSENSERRPIYDLLCKFRALLQNNCMCALLFLLGVTFFSGLLFGAASCGSYLGQFNSPILTCLDNFFISDTYTNTEEFRGVV